MSTHTTINDPALAAEIAAYRAEIAAINDRVRAAAAIAWRPTAAEIKRRRLVAVDGLGMHVKRAELSAFVAAARTAYHERTEARRTHVAGAIAAALIDADRDEYAALILLGLSFHDDRGDGKLWVPALRDRATREAWARACAALGIESRARMCLR